MQGNLLPYKIFLRKYLPVFSKCSQENISSAEQMPALSVTDQLYQRIELHILMTVCWQFAVFLQECWLREGGDTQAPCGRLVGRRDLHHFLVRCRKRRLNQALSVVSLNLGFFWVCFVPFIRATFCVALFYVYLCSVSWLIWLSCHYQCKWLTGKTRLRNDCTHSLGVLGVVLLFLSFACLAFHLLPLLSLQQNPNCFDIPLPDYLGVVETAVENK